VSIVKKKTTLTQRERHKLWLCFLIIEIQAAIRSMYTWEERTQIYREL